jgi:hypothetical protein
VSATLQDVNDYIEVGLTHSLHTSERRSFRGCRRRWNWLFRHYYYPTETAKPLEFGVAYHVGMETFYNPLTWERPREVVLELAIQAFRKTCDAQLAEYERVHGEPDREKLEDFKERKALGEGMIRYHATEVAPVLDYKKYRPVKVEIKFEVPIKNPATGEQLWCKCETCWHRYQEYWTAHEWPPPSYYTWKGLPVSYGGRIDAIFEDLSTGEYWVVDWKTAAQLAEETQKKLFLSLDDQITSYVWALNECGIRVIGFLYHEQKKAFPEEPDVLHHRYKGGLFSRSKSAVNSNADIYERTVKENDPEAYELGVYDEFIAYLKEEGGRFHARYPEYRTDKQLQQCAINIYKEATEMINQSLSIYPNAGRFNCQYCAFSQPCLEQNSDGDVLYTLESLFEKRKYHYWEDKKPSTESKGGE